MGGRAPPADARRPRRWGPGWRYSTCRVCPSPFFAPGGTYERGWLLPGITGGSLEPLEGAERLLVAMQIIADGTELAATRPTPRALFRAYGGTAYATVTLDDGSTLLETYRVRLPSP